jgi:hypothetical protein
MFEVAGLPGFSIFMYEEKKEIGKLMDSQNKTYQ